MHIDYKRGDIVLVDLEPVRGSEQGKTRPCIIVQNDVANRFSPVINIVPLTDAKKVNKWYKCLVHLSKAEPGLDKDSAVQCNQIRTVYKKERILKKLGEVSEEKMKEINQALKIHLDLTEED